MLKLERLNKNVPELKKRVAEEIIEEYKDPFFTELDMESYQFGYKVALANLGYVITESEDDELVKNKIS
jgi:hypothetical protein